MPLYHGMRKDYKMNKTEIEKCLNELKNYTDFWIIKKNSQVIAMNIHTSKNNKDKEYFDIPFEKNIKYSEIANIKGIC